MQIYVPQRPPGVSRLLFRFGHEGQALRQSLSIIENVIITDALDPLIGRMAYEITRGCGNGYICRIKAIHDWLRARYSYRDDPADRDQFKSPSLIAREILERGYFTGDCDDAVLISGALLKAMGYPLRLIAISRDRIPRAKDVDHVALLVILPDGREIYFDITVSFLPEPMSKFLQNRIVIKGDAF